MQSKKIFGKGRKEVHGVGDYLCSDDNHDDEGFVGDG